MNPHGRVAIMGRAYQSWYTIMPQPFTDPVVLFSNGIPISPADLDFGGQVTKEQINRLSSFSQMVNSIPSSTSKVWVPTGSMTWDIYERVLTMAQFADSATAAAPASGGYTTRDISVAGTSGALSLSVPTPSLELGAGLAMASMAVDVTPALEEIGFRFKVPLLAPVREIRSRAALAESSLQTFGGTSVGLASVFRTLAAQLQVEKRSDTTGTIFFPTPFFPADFYSSSYAENWRPFEITPQPGDLWLPVGDGGKITGEMITVLLQRSWWSPWVFSNRAWRFSPASGMGALSDGGNPASGMMPLFCSALLIARNVQVVAGQGVSRGPLLSVPFTLNRSVGVTAEIPSPLSDASASVPMMIFGFVCTALPKSPNPDPFLQWPA